MPRVHHVKKARKAIPHAGIEVGDSYYWWQFAYAPKSVSKTPPTRSMLTRSDFLSQLYDLEDSFGPSGSREDVVAALEELADALEALGDEQDEKKSNMPDGLQESETGQLLEARAEGCRSLAEEIRSAASEMEDSGPEHADDEEGAVDDEDDTWAQQACEVVEGLDWSIE